MADQAGKISTWYTRFSFEDNVLDILLIGWLGWAVIVVLIVNALLLFFGPIRKRDDLAPWMRRASLIPDEIGALSPVARVLVPSGETCTWLNQSLTWFFLHCNNSPFFFTAWVQALNEQIRKLGGPVQVKLEKVQSGSLPPKFSDIHHETGPDDTLVVTGTVESRDLAFVLFASQHTNEGVKLTNCTANIHRLRAPIKLIAVFENDEVKIKATLDGRVDVKMDINPINPYLDPAELVDLGSVEEAVRNALPLAVTTINISRWLDSEALPRTDVPIRQTAGNKMPRPQAVFEPIQPQEFHSSFYQPGVAPPAKPPRAVGEKRLLTKVIKASGLGSDKSSSTDPFCIIHLDNPAQRHTTSIVKATINPFWDEQFLFDVNAASRDIKFEIYDNGKAPGDDFLGESTIYFEDLKKNPSCRQILPLQPRSGSMEYVTGSLTLEFLFMEHAEADALIGYPVSAINYVDKQTSPRRRIETNRSVTSGGTVVTKTTTTTQKPQNARLDASYDGMPKLVEIRCIPEVNELSCSSSSSIGRVSPRLGLPLHDQSLSASSELIVLNGVESVADTAIRELLEKTRRPRTPTKTSTLIITSVKRTINSSPTDDTHEGLLTNTAGSQLSSDKKKPTFAQTLKKRFSRPKKRSQSADRASSLREGENYLRPPDARVSGSKTTDDIEVSRSVPNSPNIKKTRSLGGSLKKLFRRGRKRSRTRGETSRDSSLSRSSARNPEASREGSVTRQSHPSQQRASFS